MSLSRRGDFCDCDNRHRLHRGSDFPTVFPQISGVKLVGLCPLGSLSNGFYVSSFSEKLQKPKPPWIISYIYTLRAFLFTLLTLLTPLFKMSDFIRRNLQDLNLGANDEAISLPPDLCVQAASANRFTLVGTTVNPRKQPLRPMLSHMPRLWGLGNAVIGRIVGPNCFQFIFQSEEAMNLTLSRGPWSFNEWMLVLQKWSPNFPEEELKIIPFWIQIRGIPLQFLTEQMIRFVARHLGEVMTIDFDATSTRVDFVRVKVNWNLDNPLRFQRNFQFGVDQNTLLKFWFERLRNFCNKCGMLTYDAKECPLNDFDDDDNDDNDPGNEGNGDQENQRVVEREYVDGDLPMVPMSPGFNNDT
ncbi:uncharacterized protein LOC112088519 [Eutrema salsugineum]|uniref:uncharacterized protein LOC112088519 n=1 Tax=Eutrema salsugineum TaxID=72664 RepID=UPI000CED2E1F|nr:uncharacterized protein LOC112088519 [Eutrema salsugineum]